MSSDRIQLFIILSIMFFLFLFGVGASAIFIRQWRRENQTRIKKDSEKNGAH